MTQIVEIEFPPEFAEVVKAFDEHDPLHITTLDLKTYKKHNELDGSSKGDQREDILIKGVTITEVGVLTAIAAVKFSAAAALGVGILPPLALYGGYRWWKSSSNNSTAEYEIAEARREKRREAAMKYIGILTARKALIETQNAAAREISKDKVGERSKDRCAICQDFIISEDDKADVPPRFFQLMCMHILHLDCYNQMKEAGFHECQVCKKPLQLFVPRVPSIKDFPDCKSKPPKDFFEMLEDKVFSAYKITTDLLKIGTILVAQIGGSILMYVGKDLLFIWIPSLTPVILAVGVYSAKMKTALALIAASLGISALAIAGGAIMYTIGVKLAVAEGVIQPRYLKS